MPLPLTEHFPFTDLGEGPQSPEVMPLDWGFSLPDGREIHLTRIEQRPTYAGMLCGLPNSPELKVTSAIAAARTWDNDFHGETVVIPATRVSSYGAEPHTNLEPQSRHCEPLRRRGNPFAASPSLLAMTGPGLPRRVAPRNDGHRRHCEAIGATPSLRGRRPRQSMLECQQPGLLPATAFGLAAKG